jgi:hypothetical protein
MIFIPGHAITFSLPINSNIFNSLIEGWNYYEIEKNTDMIKYIWQYLSPFVPKECEGKELVGYDIKSISLVKTTSTSVTNKKISEKVKKGKNSKSLLTICLFCNSSNAFIRFYDDKKSGISFTDPKADFFTVPHTEGKAVLYTNKIQYEQYEKSKTLKCYLKIPVYYKEIFLKTFEIPTPNGEKFNKIQHINNYGNNIILTPDLSDPNNKERWYEVEMKSKPLNIQKYVLPSYINTKKGRPPTKEEDYCPNCYEIISLSQKYANCSGCLSPISL